MSSGGQFSMAPDTAPNQDPAGIGVHRAPEAEIGMLVVETIAKIRRAYFVQGKSICRDLHVSRKTVRKVIRSEETEFAHERTSQPQPKIGPWRDELDRLVTASAVRPSWSV